MKPTLALLVVAGIGLVSSGTLAAQEIAFEVRLANAPGYELQPAAVGDVDGDGAADFAVGTAGERGGIVRVISGATHARIHTLVGDAATPFLGLCLCAIGDVDLDGVGDLAVSTNGAVRVFSLQTGVPLYTVFGPSSDRFGVALSPAGDVNGDGRPDFAVGAPQVYVWGGGDFWHYSSVGPGYVEIHSGFDGSLLSTLNGPAGSSGFGGSIANGGKLDADAIDDIIVSHYVKPFLIGGSGPVRAFSGASGAQLLAVSSLASNGAQVAPLGDVDVDGIDDFAVSELGVGVRAVSGLTGATLYASAGVGSNDRFGASLARIGDRDGDGFPELLVGATQPRLTGWVSVSIGPGYARILSGRTGAVLDTIVGNIVDQGFGAGACALGDVDGDGQDEFLLTTLRDSGVFASVRVYRGRTGFTLPTNYCVGDFNSALTRASIGSLGSTSLSTNQLTLSLSNAVPGQTRVLFCGTSATAQRFNLLGAPGFLCVGGPTVRIGAPTLISTQGASQQTVDLGATSPFLAGSTWYFQFAYYSTPTQRNSSDGLAVTFTP